MPKDKEEKEKDEKEEKKDGKGGKGQADAVTKRMKRSLLVWLFCLLRLLLMHCYGMDNSHIHTCY
jgi:hypothetical protein